MKIDIKKDKYNLIELYKSRKKNFKNLIKLENSSNINSKPYIINPKTNLKLNLLEINNNQTENSKINSNENSKDKHSQLILPSIPNFTTLNKKMKINFSMNNIFRKNCLCPLKKEKKIGKIKIKKNNSFLLGKEKLLKIYNEDAFMKEKLEKYKENKKTENMGNFSYEHYNNKLIKYSSFNLSVQSYNTFKKNMKIIGNKYNGGRSKWKNKWLIFLDKIGKFAPEELKQKIISLSKKENHDNNDDSQ